MYRCIINQCTLQYYLGKPITHLYRKYLSKFRLSSHSLAIETGRYTNINFIDRKCFMCKHDVEDEFHFILKCPWYESYRKLYIKPYYYRCPSVYKLMELLSIQNNKVLCNLGKYLYHASVLRNELINKT